MNNLPKISIVMPSYNQVKFIEESILSVIKQGYPKKEFLIIDGGSTDGSIEIIKKYAEKIDYFVSEKDFCQNHAVNKGFLKATGDYIAWLNSDDTYEEGALRKVGNYLVNHPEVDLLYGQAAQITLEGNFIGWHAEPYNKYRLFHCRDIIPTQACFFRRSCLAYAGLLDTKLRWNGDWDLWKRIAQKYNVAFLDEYLANWRIHKESISYGYNINSLHCDLETIRCARKYSRMVISPIEIKILPCVIIDFLRLRPFLRKIRDKIKG